MRLRLRTNIKTYLLGSGLGGLDSNQDSILQRDAYYRYTTSQLNSQLMYLKTLFPDQISKIPLVFSSREPRHSASGRQILHSGRLIIPVLERVIKPSAMRSLRIALSSFLDLSRFRRSCFSDCDFSLS